VTTYKNTWSFEDIFPGSPEPSSFEAFCLDLTAQLKNCLQKLAEAQPSQLTPVSLTELATRIWQAAKAVQSATSYIWCLSVQATPKPYLERHQVSLENCQQLWSQLLRELDTLLLAIPEGLWQDYLTQPELEAFAFHLAQKRAEAVTYTSDREASLAHEFQANGYERWLHLRDPLIEKRIAVPVTLEDGSTTILDSGECWNPLNSGNHRLRQQVFAGWEQQWERYADLCTESLQGIVRGRLALYKNRGWESVQHEVVTFNRVQPETLEVMWQAVEEICDALTPYYEYKARLEGVQKLSWYDVYAPLDETTNRYSYEDAAILIIQAFADFSPEMADFAQQAFTNGWVDSEARPGKPSYGTAEPFPTFGRAYSLVNWSGTMYNVVTLAHELGHAYHYCAISQEPFLERSSAAGFEEMAAVMGGQLALEWAIRSAKTPWEKLCWLDFKLGDAAQYLPNQRVRFCFETRLHDLNKQRRLTVRELNTLMLEVQREVFRERLDGYHPHFWASKVQFYMPSYPFYYVSYPLGYLLCKSMMTDAKLTPDVWQNLLLDTAHLTTEALAHRYLEVDLRKPESWLKSVVSLQKDVETYTTLAQSFL
jgi:oligoendopeptidase F